MVILSGMAIVAVLILLAFNSYNSSLPQNHLAETEDYSLFSEPTIVSEKVESTPITSPDGKYITFHSQRGSIRYLWIIFSQGGTARQITFGNEEHSHPQWSPLDPDVILFVLNHKNLCTVSVATGKIEQLTHYIQSDLILDYPSWSPDGRKIYYSISRKTGDIYTLENY